MSLADLDLRWLTGLDFLRWISILLWAAVAAVLAPSAYRSVRRLDYSNDNFRAGFFFCALVTIGFALRWVIAPDDMHALAALYALSSLVAFFVVRVALAHGRGSNG